MKNILMVVVMLIAQMGAGLSASASQVAGWHGRVSVLLNANGSAVVQMGCGAIFIKNWNDEGQLMQGLESGGLPSRVRTQIPVVVRAIRQNDRRLELIIGNEAPLILSPGYAPGIHCG